MKLTSFGWPANTPMRIQSQIKMNGQLSRSIREFKGIKQGHIKLSDHYKTYINPLLDTVDSASLVGPVNVGHSACADDEYLISDCQYKLQCLLDIAEYYGAAKTKVKVIGSEIDMQCGPMDHGWSNSESLS